MDVRASQCKCVGQWMGEYHSASGWNSECAGDLAKFQQVCYGASRKQSIAAEERWVPVGSGKVPARRGRCQQEAEYVTIPGSQKSGHQPSPPPGLGVGLDWAVQLLDQRLLISPLLSAGCYRAPAPHCQ
eukprot:scaffold250121_cov22-Tisochrysis_lutea.AAC.1